jgi:hypothetical protein
MREMKSIRRKYYLLLSVILIGGVASLITGCSSSPFTPGLPEDAYQAQADAIVAVAMAASMEAPGENKPVPPDDRRPAPRVGDKCTNCNGTGRSGDGLGRCNPCGGDGKIDQEDLDRRARLLMLGLTEPAFSELGGLDSNPAPPPLIEPEAKPVKIELHVSPDSADGWALVWWKEDRSHFNDHPLITVTSVVEQSGPAWLYVCGKKCLRADFDTKPSRDDVTKLIQRVRN